MKMQSMVKAASMLAVFALINGCGATARMPEAMSELMHGSSYFPLSPKPIEISARDNGAPPTSRELLDSLPNETTRISVGTVDQTGTMNFGVGAIGEEGHSYEVIVDYIKYTTAYIPVCFTSLIESDKGRYIAGEKATVLVTASGKVGAAQDTHVETNPKKMNSSEFSLVHKVPIYIGVGLRIQASIQVLKGKVELNLAKIGSAASAGSVSGTMVVQTLGVFGEPVSVLLPLPSDVTQSSIQAGMQSLAALKAKLYSKDVGTRPQVIGFDTIFSTAPAVQLIEATIEGTNIEAKYAASELHANPIELAPGVCPAAQAPVPQTKSPERRGD